MLLVWKIWIATSKGIHVLEVLGVGWRTQFPLRQVEINTSVRNSNKDLFLSFIFFAKSFKTQIMTKFKIDLVLAPKNPQVILIKKHL